MADDGQILLEIVLDDGSVQRGFAKIKKEGESTGRQVTKSFDGIGDAIDEISPKASRAFSNLQRIITNPFVAAGATIAAVGASVAGAFKLAAIGDQALLAERSVDNFAKGVGVNADKLRKAFDDVSLGIIDTGDALESSRIAIAELGAEASRLPQVFKLAQNIAVSSGQDILTVYNQLNQAILSTNTRSLRSIGLFLDGDQALRKYAESIGKTTAELTLAEKQQVLLNATLEKGSKTFQDASADALTLGQRVQSVRAELNQLIDEVGKQISQSNIGSFLRDISQGLASGIKRYREELETSRTAFNNSDSAAKELVSTTNKLKQLQEELLNLPDDLGQDSVIRSQRLQVEIAQLQARKAALEAYIPQALQAEELANRELENTAKRIELDKQATENAIALAEARKKAAEDLILFRQAEIEYQQTITDGTVQVGANIGAFANQIATLGSAIKTQAGQAKLSYTDLANTINTGFVSALQNVGAALVTGANAGKAFGDAVLGTIGQLAVQLGQFFILTGIAQSATPVLGLAGGAAIAAGVALTVFGGALSAIARQSSGTATASAGAVGGGAAVTTSPSFNQTEFDLNEVERQAPGTEVVVNIQGDVLDSDETGIRIVDVLNQAFDKKGVSLRRGLA